MEASEWDERYRGAELVWGSEPNRWVVAELAELRPGAALDVACGEGRNAIWLALRSWRVTGLDFSAVGLRRAASLAERAGVADRTSWVQADAVEGEYPAGPFDVVVLAYLQLAAPARRAAVCRAATVLAPGGVLLVIGHDTSNLTQGVGGPQDAAVLFSPDDVVADLAGVAGIRVERAERVRRPVATPDGERDAIDALVRVTR